MNFIQHIQSVYRKHKPAFMMSTILVIILLVLGILEESIGKTIIYLLAIAGSILISEFIYFTGNLSHNDWKIKQPAKELYIIIVTQIIVTALLVYWFMIADQQAVSKIIRVTTLVLRFLFAFPIFFLIYFLAIQKYTLRELGFLRFKYWFVCLPIIVLIGGISYLTYPEGIQFKEAVEENGYSAFITLGFLTAAIPEEITRNLFQSRLGSVLKNKSIAWFLASLIWALLHIPYFAFNSVENYYSATISAL